MLKNSIAAFVLATVSFSALAGGSISVEHERVAGQSRSISIIPAVEVADMVVDAKLTAVRGKGDSNVDSSAELRVRKDVNLVGNVGIFGRAGVGKAFADGNSLTFYSVEPGFTYAATPKLVFNTSYRYAQAFNRTHAETRVNTAFIGAEYALTEQDGVGIRLFKDNGNNKGNGFEAGYTRFF